MRAVTWQGFEDVRVEDVADPRIEQPTDAIVVIPFNIFVTHRSPLDAAPEAYAQFEAKQDGTIKVVLQP